MRDFNMGIMLSHIMLAAEELWMNMETVTEEQFLRKPIKTGIYLYDCIPQLRKLFCFRPFAGDFSEFFRLPVFVLQLGCGYARIDKNKVL